MYFAFDSLSYNTGHFQCKDIYRLLPLYQESIIELVLYSKMKGSKSKGKCIVKPQPQSQPAKRKRQSSTQPINNIAKEFTVHFMHGKVAFNITQIDPILARALVYSFNNSKYNLTQSSLLLQLKVQKQFKFQVTYRHTLDAREAVFLYTKLRRRRIGDVNELEQLKELVDIIELYPLESRELEGEYEVERQKLNQQIEKIRRIVKGNYQKLKQTIKNNYQKSEQHLKARLLQAKIKELSANLIDLMIVAVREVNPNKIEVIFEQPYPEKTCAPSFLINVIGQARYIKKKINFVRYYREARLKHRANTNFIVCHICKGLLVDSYLKCTNKEEKQLTPTYQNSPNIFHRHFLAVDYCYHKITELTNEQMEQELDYFKYYSPVEEQKVCNRFVCNKCSQKWVLLENSSDIFNFCCTFCTKICTCQSCAIAQQLVKSLALYKEIIIKNSQPISKYHELISYANFDHPVDVQVFSRIRNTFKSNEKKEYFYYYENNLESYLNINKIMEKMQHEAIRSYALFEQIKMMITEEMTQVRSFISSWKNKKETQASHSNSKSLPEVRGQDQIFGSLLEKKKEMQKLEENIIIKYLRENNTKNKHRSLTTKQKIMKNLTLSQKTQKYQVPFEVNELLQFQQIIQQGQLTEIQKNLTSKLKAMDISLIDRVAGKRKQIPFEDDDYDLAINVKHECKIVSEKDIQIRKNIDDKIMYEEDHAIYGFRGVGYNRFHNQPEDFIYALENSSQSEDNESVYEVLQTPFRQPNSVSISSSFLRKHSVSLSKSESNQSDQAGEQQEESVEEGDAEDAFSEFLILDETEIQQIQMNKKRTEDQMSVEKLQPNVYPQSQQQIRETQIIQAREIIDDNNQITKQQNFLRHDSPQRPQQNSQIIDQRSEKSFSKFKQPKLQQNQDQYEQPISSSQSGEVKYESEKRSEKSKK